MVEPVKPDDDLMTKENWIKQCDAGYLINYDGFAEYSDGINKYGKYIYPSERASFDSTYTHVVWYNR